MLESGSGREHPPPPPFSEHVMASGVRTEAWERQVDSTCNWMGKRFFMPRAPSSGCQETRHASTKCSVLVLIHGTGIFELAS